MLHNNTNLHTVYIVAFYSKMSETISNDNRTTGTVNNCDAAGHVTTYVPYRSLCSTDQTLVVVPRINLERFSRQAFLHKTLIVLESLINDDHKIFMHNI